MIRVEKFECAHAEELLKSTKEVQFFGADEQTKMISNYGYSDRAFSAFNAGGRIIFCGGIDLIWKGRGILWSIFSHDCKTDFLLIFRAIERFLKLYEDIRVEAEVMVNFEAGHRLMKLLGFKVEAPRMEAFFPSGHDATLYAKVRR